MNALIRYDELASDLGVRAVADHPLAPHTTLRIGGPADWAFFPRTPQQAAALWGELKRCDLPVRILGAGSNLLISDKGVRAAVILTSEMDAQPQRRDACHVFATAGTPIPGLARWAARQGLAGLEFAEGIPALLGGGLRMNAGANGSCFAEIVERVLVAGEDGTVDEQIPRDGDFAYRESFIARSKRFALGAVLALGEQESEQIKQRMATYRERRKTTQPLTDRSAGCAFRNLPGQPPCGALAEQLGLKGYSIGGAQVSTRHGNFVINNSNATFGEIRALLDHLREKILQETGVTPQLEIEIWEEAQ